jgi:4,5-DOPA dioxygenase extradiol
VREADALFHRLIDEDRHAELIDYPSLGRSVQLAVPTPEHYLPMLYILALKEKGETLAYFNDQPVAGSLRMTSFVIG